MPLNISKLVTKNGQINEFLWQGMDLRCFIASANKKPPKFSLHPVV